MRDSQSMPPGPRNPEQKSNRLAVYTVLIGDKEPLGNPLAKVPPGAASDVDMDFICFTDNHALKSDVWQFRYIDSGYLPPEKLSRRPKALPHEYLPDYSLSLYIDNTVVFKRLPAASDLVSAEPCLLRAYKHATRNTPGEEADAVVAFGYDDVDTVCSQLDYYRKIRWLDRITALCTCTILLRSHHHPKVKEFGVIWWEQILNFSKRDQISFDFSAARAGCPVSHFPGLKHDNDFIEYQPEANGPRVKASFDPVRYAWRHRGDPAALANPKAHYLAAAREGEPECARRLDLFQYICHKTGSSLGDHVAPRRSVAVPLGDVLARYRESAGTMLVVRIRDNDNPLRFLDEEFTPGASACSIMLPQYKAQVLELDVADVRLSSAVFSGPAGMFDILVVLGLPPDSLYSFFEKFSRILNPAKGLIVALATGSGDLGIAKLTQNQIDSRFAVESRISVSFSRHDDLDGPISNSLACFEWQARMPTL